MDRIAISNIAWPAADDAEALRLCADCGFTGIEIAPGRTIPGWPSRLSGTADLRAIAGGLGLPVVAMQGILFGVDGVSLFAGDESRARLAAHLRRVARLAGALGAKACVYGAPATRDPGNLPYNEARDIAAAFLISMAPVFESEGTALTFEANDTSYGCRFVTRTAEAIDLVRRVGRPGVRVQIDTGTVFLAGEPPSVIAEAVPLAAHFHASEPALRPLGGAGADHRPLAAALDRAGYAGWRSVEMRATPDWRNNIRRAATLMAATYAGAAS